MLIAQYHTKTSHHNMDDVFGYGALFGQKWCVIRRKDNQEVGPIGGIIQRPDLGPERAVDERFGENAVINRQVQQQPDLETLQQVTHN